MNRVDQNVSLAICLVGAVILTIAEYHVAGELDLSLLAFLLGFVVARLTS